MRILAASVLLVLSALPAHADLLGLEVRGAYELADNRFVNYFDPASGGVPEGTSGIQPLAVVADPDGEFVEFTMGTGTIGCSMDLDANTLTVTWFTDADNAIFPAAYVTAFGLGGRVTGVTVLETVDFARVSLQDDWVQVRTVADFRVLADAPVVVKLQLDVAVPVEDAAWSALKFRYR